MLHKCSDNCRYIRSTSAGADRRIRQRMPNPAPPLETEIPNVSPTSRATKRRCALARLCKSPTDRHPSSHPTRADTAVANACNDTLTSDGITKSKSVRGYDKSTPTTPIRPPPSIFQPSQARKSLAPARNWRMCNERFPSTSSIVVSNNPNAGMQAHSRATSVSCSSDAVSATAYCAQPTAPQCDRSQREHSTFAAFNLSRSERRLGRDTPERIGPEPPIRRRCKRRAQNHGAIPGGWPIIV